MNWWPSRWTKFAQEMQRFSYYSNWSCVSNGMEKQTTYIYLKILSVMDRWQDGLCLSEHYFISRLWEGDYQVLCAMKWCLGLERILPSARLELKIPMILSRKRKMLGQQHAWPKCFGFWFLFYGPSTHFRSFQARSVTLTTLFLGKPPRQFTSA